MDELDLLKALSRESLEGEENLAKLKTAGIVDSTKAFGSKALREATKDPKLTGLVLAGGAGGGAAQYLSSKPGKDGLSSDQKLTRKAVAALDREGKEESFPAEMGSSFARYSKDVSDVFAKHPGKASILGAAGGASFAHMLGKKLLKK